MNLQWGQGQNADNVAASFAKQGLMTTLGARLIAIVPGQVEIEMAITAGVCQQHGVVHAGATTSIADTACGYSALTLLPGGADVVSVEFKLNLLAPAMGQRLVAKGRVIRNGKTLSICQADVWNDSEQHVATMLATIIRKDLRS